MKYEGEEKGEKLVPKLVPLFFDKVGETEKPVQKSPIMGALCAIIRAWKKINN